jgi:hypothetical protein
MVEVWAGAPSHHQVMVEVWAGALSHHQTTVEDGGGGAKLRVGVVRGAAVAITYGRKRSDDEGREEGLTAVRWGRHLSCGRSVGGVGGDGQPEEDGEATNDNEWDSELETEATGCMTSNGGACVVHHALGRHFMKILKY